MSLEEPGRANTRGGKRNINIERKIELWRGGRKRIDYRGGRRTETIRDRRGEQIERKEVTNG